MTDQIVEKPRIRPEDNPWYLLATLYGQPKTADDEMHKRNRNAWNRYIGQALHGHVAEATTPFTPGEMQAVEKAFAERRPKDSTASAALSDIKTGHIPTIDLSDVEFSDKLYLSGFVFPVELNCSGASFSDDASSMVRSSPNRSSLTMRPSPTPPFSMAQPSPMGSSFRARPSPVWYPSTTRSSPTQPPL